MSFLRRARPASSGGLLATAILIGVALVGPSPAVASPAVTDAAEAWYDTSPATGCSSPVGCPPVTVPAMSYPADTLHVGVVAGGETSRTYLLPDLSAYIGKSLPAGGTMILPLASVSGNGNVNQASAKVEACLAKAAFSDGTAGSTKRPPPVDCDTHAELGYAGSAFTLDLGPFLNAWRAGSPEYGIALVPDPAETNSAAVWQVAFDGRNLAGQPPISSRFTSASPPVTAAPATPYQATTPSGPSAIAVPASSPPGSLPAAVLPSVPGPSVATIIPAGSSPARTSSSSIPVASDGGQAIQSLGATRGGFQYREVMLLPLVLAAALLFVIRLLTYDATPKRLKPR